jgi:protein-L-isoaspartate(D-aspartate) O-methyltransferase
MTEALFLAGGEKVLEIGTGCGYQAAILAELAEVIWTIERSSVLVEQARETLAEVGCRNVHLVEGDGTVGLAREVPFDRIVATGSLPDVPDVLLRQLSPGGILVAPVGGLHEQDLVRLVATGKRPERTSLGPCRFVPLVGEAGWASQYVRGRFR